MGIWTKTEIQEYHVAQNVSQYLIVHIFSLDLLKSMYLIKIGGLRHLKFI